MQHAIGSGSGSIRLRLPCLPLLILIATFVAFILSTSSRALADVSWLASADDCPSMGRGLAEFLSSIPDIERIDDDKQHELMEVLDAACGREFQSCDFEVCRVFDYRPKTAGNASSPAQTEADEPSAGMSLEWLNQYLTCNQLVAEIKKRYGRVGRGEEVPEPVRAEMNYVLELACSDRFMHCGFKSCNPQPSTAKQTQEPGVVDPVPQPTPVDVAKQQPAVSSDPSVRPGATREPATVESSPPTASSETAAAAISAESLAKEAAALHQRLYERMKRENRERIAALVRAESEKQLQWNRLGNPEELRLLSERRKAHRRRAREESDSPDGTFDGRYPGNTGRNGYGRRSGSGRTATDGPRRKRESTGSRRSPAVKERARSTERSGQRTPRRRRPSSDGSAPPVVPF